MVATIASPPMRAASHSTPGSEPPARTSEMAATTSMIRKEANVTAKRASWAKVARLAGTPSRFSFHDV